MYSEAPSEPPIDFTKWHQSHGGPILFSVFVLFEAPWGLCPIYTLYFHGVQFYHVLDHGFHGLVSLGLIGLICCRLLGHGPLGQGLLGLLGHGLLGQWLLGLLGHGLHGLN